MLSAIHATESVFGIMEGPQKRTDLNLWKTPFYEEICTLVWSSN